ncbi:MAG TPA: LCP family protein, partial [Euzebya sp.]|nr:LCP family protein [Euzebya sp.]
MDLLDAPTTAPPAPAPGRPRQRRASGRRSAAQARHRRAGRRIRLARRLRGTALAVLVVSAVAGLAVLVISLLPTGEDAPQPGEGDAPVGVAADQSTLLLVREEPGTRGAAGLILLATSGDGSASATFIPSTTLVEIPGVGLDRLGLAHQYGGVELIGAAVENTLGIEIDHVASVTSADLGALLQRAGGAQVDIGRRLVDRQADGTGRVLFESGEQYLNGVRLAEYWGFVQRGETELDTFPRQQRALEAMLVALDDDVLREALLEAVPPELSTTAEPAFLREVFGLLADAAVQQVLVYQLLPVAPFGSA